MDHYFQNDLLQVLIMEVKGRKFVFLSLRMCPIEYIPWFSHDSHIAQEIPPSLIIIKRKLNVGGSVGDESLA